jgi:hypothetical protein
LREAFAFNTAVCPTKFPGEKRKTAAAPHGHAGLETDTAMKNEVLCKLLCHNICVLIQSQCELGIEPVFWQNEDAGEDEPRDILTMKRPG